MTDKEKIRAEIERRIEELQPCNTRENLRAHGAIAGYYQILSFINSMQEEPVSEDLGEYINKLSKQFPEVSFAKLSRIAVRVAKWQKEQIKMAMDLGEPPYLISIEQAYYRTLKLLEE